MRLPYLILYLFIFFTGACLGSFCNVVAYRLPRKLDFVKGRSFCPACGHTLAPLDLVPFFSWLCLGGKCRYCGARISRRYPLTEAAAGLFAVASVLRFGPTWGAAVAALICCALLILSLIDADTQEIPDGLILALFVLGAAGVFAWPEPGLVARLIGAVCVSVPMLLINLLVPTSFGGGDIKLMAVMGALLGWKNALLAMFIALLLGGGYGIYLLARRKKGRKDHFAFGPFLSAGCVVALFFGDALIGWYLELFF